MRDNLDNEQREKNEKKERKLFVITLIMKKGT